MALDIIADALTIAGLIAFPGIVHYLPSPLLGINRILLNSLLGYEFPVNRGIQHSNCWYASRQSAGLCGGPRPRC